MAAGIGEGEQSQEQTPGAIFLDAFQVRFGGLEFPVAGLRRLFRNPTLGELDLQVRIGPGTRNEEHKPEVEWRELLVLDCLPVATVTGAPREVFNLIQDGVRKKTGVLRIFNVILGIVITINIVTIVEFIIIEVVAFVMAQEFNINIAPTRKSR
jgi:hypothetical protein